MFKTATYKSTDFQENKKREQKTNNNYTKYFFTVWKIDNSGANEYTNIR